MDDASFQEALIKRLNVLISLSLDVTLEGSPTTVAGKILRLIDLELTPSEIGHILGKKTSYVTAVMAKNKKKVKRKVRKDGG